MRKSYSQNLFVYGSLMREEVIKRYINRVPESEEAILRGWSRIFEPTFRPYPFLVKDASGKVNGLCYFDLSDEEIKKLDKYESCEHDLYRREKVVVEVKTDETAEEVQAEVYVGGILEEEYQRQLKEE